MVFKSDKQRKAVMSKLKGNSCKSNITYSKEQISKGIEYAQLQNKIRENQIELNVISNTKPFNETKYYNLREDTEKLINKSMRIHDNLRKSL